MTVLQRPQSRTSREGGGVPLVARARSLALAAWGGLLAAVVSAMVVAVPVLLAWFADERSAVSLWQALGFSVDTWALAHRAEVHVDGLTVAMAPLMLTLVPLLICRYAVGQLLVDRPGAATAGEVPGAREAWRAVAGPELSWFVSGYALAGLVLSWAAGLGPARVDLASLLPGLLLVPLLAVGLALLAERRRLEHAGIDRGLAWLDSHTPVLVRRGFRSGGEALAGLLVAAVLVLTVLLVVRAERMAVLYDVLDAGTVGAIVFTLGQVLLLPNVLVWALGWMAGADVTVGTVVLSRTDVVGGDLPLVPVLAALPEPGALPPGLGLVVLVPAVAGAWVGWRSARATPRLASWWCRAQVALSGVAVVAVAGLVLSWLASGGVAPGLLAAVGTPPLVVAGLLLVEVGAGALVTVTALHLWRTRL